MHAKVLTEEEDRIRTTVRALARYRGMSGADLARATGTIPMAVSARLNGKTAFGVTDLYRYAEALQVPVSTLLLEADDAVRWVLDNAPSRQVGFVTVGTALAGTLALITGLAAGHGVAPVAMLASAIAENVWDADVMSGDAQPVAA